MTVYLDKQLSGDSTEEMPTAPESVDDYEIEKKYEMVCDVSLYMKFKLCVSYCPCRGQWQTCSITQVSI